MFGSQVGHGLPGVEPRGDDRSRDAGSGDHWLAITYRPIHQDQPRLVRRSLHDKWIELEEALGIAFDALPVEFHHSGDQDLLIVREIHNLANVLNEQVAAIGLESLLHEGGGGAERTSP